MQGIESLDNFKKFVSSLGGLGRYEDTYIVHAAEGETVVPMEVLDKNPALKKRLFKTMMDMGIEPGRYIVGNELNSKNPVTGQPEFFLKKIVSQIRKALPGDTEQFLGPIVGLATGSLPLGAIAGAIGSGVPGAIGGGIAGLRSPGLALFRESDFNYMPVTKKGFVDPLKLSDLSNTDRLREIFLGKDGEKGIFGSTGKFFNFADRDKPDLDTIEKEIIEAGNDPKKIRKILDKINLSGNQRANLIDALKAGVPLTLALGFLIDQTTPEGPVGAPIDPVTGEVITSVLNPIGVSPSLPTRAEGGVMDLRQGGESEGPGTGTSDDIPAMLSDGEFVMTAKAVRGAGGGDRREGAKRMYEAMDRLEAQA